MAWETRHIKVQILNDSQYIGTCVYCTVTTSIIVLLSNIISNYVILSYLATTLSILISVTITLILLFFPKIRAISRRVDIEDSVMQSMGLKIESKTRRLVTNDTKELIYRLEVQNKVYRSEIKALDREIARLENIVNSHPTSSSSSSNRQLYKLHVISNNELQEEMMYSTINRASWPNCKQTVKSSDKFLSERKLSKNSTESFFKKLKNLFENIPTMWISTSTLSEDEGFSNGNEVKLEFGATSEVALNKF